MSKLKTAKEPFINPFILTGFAQASFYTQFFAAFFNYRDTDLKLISRSTSLRQHPSYGYYPRKKSIMSKAKRIVKKVKKTVEKKEIPQEVTQEGIELYQRVANGEGSLVQCYFDFGSWVAKHRKSYAYGEWDKFTKTQKWNDSFIRRSKKVFSKWKGKKLPKTLTEALGNLKGSTKKPTTTPAARPMPSDPIQAADMFVKLCGGLEQAMAVLSQWKEKNAPAVSLNASVLNPTVVTS